MSTHRRLIGYLRPHAGTLALGLMCAAAVSVITVGIGWFIKQGIDAMSKGNARGLSLMCALVVVVFLVKGVFAFGQSYLLSLTANRISTSLRDQIYAHMHSLSLSFFNRKRTGGLLSVLTNDVFVIQNAATSLRDVVAAPATIAIGLAGLFVCSWRLALIATLFIPFMAAVMSRVGKHIRRISSAVQARLANVTTIIEETVAGARIIKSFATETREIGRFSDENRRTLQTIMKFVRRSAQLRPLIEFIGAFGVAAVLYVGGHMVADGRNYQITEQQNWVRAHPGIPIRETASFPIPAGAMTEGTLIAFLYLLNAVARSTGDLGGIVTLRAQALAAARRIFDEVLDIEIEVRERPDAIQMPPIKGHVRFENVSFRYRPDTPDVLRNVAFDVLPGEVVAIVGRSGAGKSTLVDLIPRFYDATEGRVLIDGIDVRDVRLDSLRRQIGIVPQDTWLFAGTLRDNIAYGHAHANDEQIADAAWKANAFFIQGMEKRFDTVIGERGVRLSGGERQRIAIARAILTDPRLLILDEATSSLDASSEALVQEALDELMRARTTIVIAHRLSTIINADRILAMEEGRIIEMGSHRELIAAGGYYAHLYETQLRGFE